eukprot:g14190.t1
MALLTQSYIHAGEGSQAGESSQLLHSYSSPLQQPHQEQAQAEHLTTSAPVAATLLDRITGGANPSNRGRKHSSRGAGHQPGGGGGGSVPDAIEISGVELPVGSSGGRPLQQQHLDGVYVREWDVNGAPHFKRRSKRGSRSSPVHLFFTGKEWMLHLDVDANLDINHCLAYSEVSELNPLKTTRKWAVRVGQAWVRRPHMRLAETSPEAEPKGSSWRNKEGTGGSEGVNRYDGSSSSGSSRADGSIAAAAADAQRAIGDAALNRRLLPLYAVFVLDAVGLGVALPVLPFFVMGLKATALQLAIVVSSNYIAQTFGCVFTGNMSDVMGRKPVVIGCLLGTVISHIMVARSTTLAGVAWGRVVGGVTGGLTPIAQAAVADVVPVQSLPKFLGRIQACVGLGFVLGPMTMTILHRLLKVSTADTFYAAALFPLVGLFYALIRLEETKSGETGVSQLWKRRSGGGGGGGGRGTSTPESAGPLVGFEADRRAKEGRDRALASRRRRRRREGAAGEAGGFADCSDGYGYGYGDYSEDGAAEAPEDAAAYDEFQEDGAAATAAAAAYRAAVVEEPGRAEAGGGDRAAGVRSSVADDGAGVGAVQEVIPRAVMLLVGNGFLLMYAFSIETIYAMFLKDNFGYGESVLSMVFALNGVAVGALQLLGMRHLVRLLGKHMMLITGNVFLAAGMLGVALSRNPVIHFALFTVHILGYSLADTALVALISRYASASTQGRSLGLNQAAQSMARVISPVVAGVLYEWSKRRQQLPLGALPYLVGSVFPMVGVAVPFWLYLRSVEAKKRSGVCARGGGGGSAHDSPSIFEPSPATEIEHHQKRL